MKNKEKKTGEKTEKKNVVYKKRKRKQRKRKKNERERERAKTE